MASRSCGCGGRGAHKLSCAMRKNTAPHARKKEQSKRDARLLSGLCVICGKERGDGGTKNHCRDHAQKVSERGYELRKQRASGQHATSRLIRNSMVRLAHLSGVLASDVIGLLHRGQTPEDIIAKYRPDAWEEMLADYWAKHGLGDMP